MVRAHALPQQVLLELLLLLHWPGLAAAHLLLLRVIKAICLLPVVKLVAVRVLRRPGVSVIDAGLTLLLL